MNEKHIEAYFKVVWAFAHCSTAQRLKVGSIIVKDHNILSFGYNGTPSGWDNVCEEKEWCNAGGWLDAEEIESRWPFEGTYLDSEGFEMHGRYRLKTLPHVLHSELNAIAKLARGTGGAEGATMFCTHGPCIECAKLIHACGIKEVYFNLWYRDKAGVEFLTKAGINVRQIDLNK